MLTMFFNFNFIFLIRKKISKNKKKKKRATANMYDRLTVPVHLRLIQFSAVESRGERHATICMR